MMSITVKFFASLREQTGIASTNLNIPGSINAGEVWQQVAGGLDMPANTLVAINMEYVDIHHTVKDGDEIAFFPPVTGG